MKVSPPDEVMFLGPFPSPRMTMSDWYDCPKSRLVPFAFISARCSSNQSFKRKGFSRWRSSSGVQGGLDEMSSGMGFPNVVLINKDSSVEESSSKSGSSTKSIFPIGFLQICSNLFCVAQMQRTLWWLDLVENPDHHNKTIVQTRHWMLGDPAPRQSISNRRFPSGVFLVQLIWISISKNFQSHVAFSHEK